MDIIQAIAPDKEYPIFIGEGWLETLPKLLEQRHLDGPQAIVTNDTIAVLYADRLRALLPAATLITVPDGESYKTLDTVGQLYEAFVEAELDRRAVIIAFGGGVIGDMVGFAAATFLRGVAFVQIPTSLLAMVDSSVGGKVGIDLPHGKNLVGAFKQPDFVVVDPSVLHTLPDIEWRCGVAEVIKAGLLHDPTLLDAKLYQRHSKPEIRLNFIRRAIQFKVDVVAEDPYEHGQRAILNLGHTFGHAIEKVSNFAWRHGEAVGLGLVAAARLSQFHGLCEPALPYRVENLVKAVGLPTRYTALDPLAIRAAMNTDKKRQGRQVRFILLKEIGVPVIVEQVPEHLILRTLESMQE